MYLYRYLTGPDDAAFCARVTTALNLGWELYGAPTMTFNGVNVIVGQVVRGSDDKAFEPGMDVARILSEAGF
jgi:hypothetical protein